LAIPDANPIGLVRSITLSGLSTARPYNVQLSAQIDGTGEGAFLGDYTLLLRHYTTGESIVEQTAILLNQNDLISNGLNATFSSNLGNDIVSAQEVAGSPLTGTYRSNGLSALGGMDPNGVWQLFVGDASGGATGNLVGWSLLLDEVPLVGTSGPSPLTYEIVDGAEFVSRNVNSITAISGTGQVTVRAVAAAKTGYAEGSQTVVINLEKITPKITKWPTTSSIFLGQTLASAALTEGSADISGTFTFASPSTVPAAGMSSHSVTFTPSESANYNTVTELLSVEVILPPPVNFGSAATLTTAPTSYIDIPNVLTGDFTICFRLKTTEGFGELGQWYFGRGLIDGEIGGVANDFGVCLAIGRIAFGMGNPDVTLLSNSSVNDGVWHAIAVTRSGSEMKIYIDGVENASRNDGPTGGRVVSNLRIGMQATGANGSLNGQIDDVRLYTSASKSYVDAAVTGPLTTFPETNLAAYYPLDGSANDVSGNNRNGTPVNVSWSPGQSPGVWDLAQGDYQLENDGNRLLLELGGEKPLYDQIFVRNGAATLDGIVNLMFYGTYTGPVSGSWQAFDLVWAQNGIVFGDDYQLIFNQAGYTVDTAVVEKDGGQLWQATVREVVTQEDLEQAVALAQPALGVAKSPGANGSVEMMYTYSRPTGGTSLDGRYMVGGLSYEIQYSSDLKTWVGATVEELSTVPAGDGMEDITVRVISNSSRGFLRLKVSQ
jgi:hypothetical protein